MLCSKFEVIPTSNFYVMTILRKRQKSEKKNQGYSPWFFVKSFPGMLLIDLETYWNSTF